MRGMREETLEKIHRVIDRVTLGAALKDACADETLALTTFRDALSSVREVATLYARAKEIRAVVLTEEGMQIVDDEGLDPNSRRIRWEARRWFASKLDPKTYGDRIDMHVDGQVSVLGAISDTAVRSMRDLAPVMDAQVVDPPSLGVAITSDSISESVRPALPCALPGQLE